MDFSNPATIIFLCVICFLAGLEVIAPIMAACMGTCTDDCLEAGFFVSLVSICILGFMYLGALANLESYPNAPVALAGWATLGNLPYALSWGLSYIIKH